MYMYITTDDVGLYRRDGVEPTVLSLENKFYTSSMHLNCYHKVLMSHFKQNGRAMKSKTSIMFSVEPKGLVQQVRVS